MDSKLLVLILGILMLFGFGFSAAYSNPMVAIPYHIDKTLFENSKLLGFTNKNIKIDISVGLKLRNYDQLLYYLKEVSTPGSPLYLKFISKNEFISEFSPSEQVVMQVSSYFESYGVKVEVGPYNLALFMNNVPLYKAEEMFHTTFGLYYAPIKGFNHYYFAPIGNVYLPSYIAQYVNGISGLTNMYKYSFDLKISKDFINSGGVQILTGGDMEKAYQTYLLFNGSANGSPSNTHYFATKYTVATILWEGVDSNGNQVAPFNPSDVISYYQQVVPQWIQNIVGSTPNVTGDPVNGAVPPGPSAGDDSTEANFESTLDLEMVTTLAPGVNAVEVYGPGNSSGPSETNFPDEGFAAASKLSNLVAVSNSWGGGDVQGDNITQNYVHEMEATGTTVMAAAGDDGDTSQQSYPANDATNVGGFLAVGGLTVTLNGNAGSYNGAGVPAVNAILNQVVWYANGQTQSNGDTVGTTSGTSSAYPMPSWQDIPAVVNNGGSTSGRDVADISAIGNNTFIYITNTSQRLQNGGSPWFPLGGTSVASPVIAGIIAEIVAYTGHKLGFINPLLYKMGPNESKYSLKPFWDVVQTPYGYHAGQTQYDAKPGWDYPSGWGSINAYNFSLDLEQMLGLSNGNGSGSSSGNTSGSNGSSSPATYTVTFTESGLSGITCSVTFNGNTKSSTTSTISFAGITNGTYSFSVGNVSGYTANPSSGTITVNGKNVNQNIQFIKNSINNGTNNNTKSNNNTNSNNTNSNNTNNNTTVKNIGEIVSQVNSTSISTYSLPEAEEFVVSNNAIINYVTLYLNGSGQVNFSIGTNLWSSNVLNNITINVVSGKNWYNVSINNINLVSGVYYFLNVYLVSGNVEWGYTSNPSSNSFNYLFDYYYINGILNSDYLFPFIFIIGYS
ncbi:MAG: S53 family peptidase [Thermoplasmata archaeon]